MRVLQLITRNELRGAEVFAAQLSERLASRGHKVCLAGLYSPLRPEDPRLEPLGVQAVELRGRTKGRIEPAVLLRLRRLLTTSRAEVVQANGFHALKYMAVLKSLRVVRQPIVYRNISQASRWVRGGLHHRYGRWVARHADLVLSVSDASAADFVEVFDYPMSRIQTVRRGIELPAVVDREGTRERLVQLLGCGRNDMLLFHLGGFTEEKNHAGLLQSFELIRDRHSNARLVLCGDGPLRGEIEAAIAQKRLGGHVFCLGNREDARDLLAGGDLLLLTSHVEGIPGVVLEAAARGIPSVATDVGAVGEAVRHEKTGLLVRPGDAAAFAEAACGLLDDEARRLLLGEQARRLVSERHEMTNVISEFEEHYRRLVDSAPSGPLPCGNTPAETC